MNLKQIITLARKHVGNGAEMASSARICLEEAVDHYDHGDFEFAKRAALRSLRYSVGVFHADYQKAAKE